MANNYLQGIFTPTNPDKYIGHTDPRYRSGWELTVMRFCDNHPSIIGWASESLRIPYRNPFTGKQTVYVPDFLITYQDKNGNKKCKSCGRQKGEKRSKYPSCRPTPGACSDKGKGKSWGKKSEVVDFIKEVLAEKKKKKVI